MATRKKLTPRTARTVADVCALRHDNVATPEHWIITDGRRVTIAAQRTGEPCTGKVSLPLATFEAFIDWYDTGRFRSPVERPAAKAS